MYSTRPWWRDAVINRRASLMALEHTSRRSCEWWENAVIYQISPFIFKDSNGDGIGDLQGIIERLDYIDSLGVDALWLTPIFDSPMDDFGYDVRDLRRVSPLFGSRDDLDRLIELAHQRNLRIVLDMVWSHTSDQHPWFRQSRRSRDNDWADWYVWADPAPDGGPPNNWLSTFSGRSAWHFEPCRGQYYLANFLPSQPDLNWYNPRVRAEILELARFWLDAGIDGLRLDAVNFYCHDPGLADNPPREPGMSLPHGLAPNNPLAAQRLVNAFSRPETLEFLAPLRALADQYPGVMLLGEVIEAEDSIDLAAQYTQGDDRLHLAYHGGLLFDGPMQAGRLRQVVAQVLERFGQRGACWIVGNHDFGRLHSQWRAAEENYPPAFYRLLAALLLSLPGAFCLWQGDELGLRDARIPEDIPPERLQDPYGRAMYPRLPGRDGARTPMPWDHRMPNGGFSHADETWLPVPESHRPMAVSRQQSDPHSTLCHWRRLLHWRLMQPALVAGSTRLLALEEPLFGLLREDPEQRLLALFNLSAQAVEVDLDELGPLVPASGLGYEEQCGPRIQLPAWGVLLADAPQPR